MRAGRGPEYRHIIYLLYSGEEGVDTSDNSFVCHLFDRPRGKQFETVLAFRENFESGANLWRGRRSSGVDPIECTVPLGGAEPSVKRNSTGSSSRIFPGPVIVAM